MEHTVLHIVGGNSRSRAEQARMAFALGHHAEVYGEIGELLDQRPSSGAILVWDDGAADQTRALIDRLGAAGIWLGVVITAADAEVERVVQAIKAGALDYLVLPMDISAFARRLRTILWEAAPYQQRRRRQVEAMGRIRQLSPRERQVLGLLSAGQANKEIAQTLDISPRTVEIHRGNMMAKLGAKHPADVVKTWLAAGLDDYSTLSGSERPAVFLRSPQQVAEEQGAGKNVQQVVR